MLNSPERSSLERPFWGKLPGRLRTSISLTALVALTTLLGGCLNRDLKPVLPCTVSGVAEDVKINPIDKVDLLMLVDNSGSMLDEQEKLRRELPRLVQVLASGDLQAGQPAGTEGLGEADFPALSSLRVGVITPDLGTTPVMVDSCSSTGDDAELVSTTSDSSAEGCSDWPSSFIEISPRDKSTQEHLDFGEQAGCVATTGTGGCGFEQQLEALLKSVIPSGSGISPPFAHSDGKGDINNFVREDSLLVVLMITDEEDCSTPNAEVFNDSSTSLRVNLPEFEGKGTQNYRCAAFEDQLYKVQRYVDGLLELRDDPGNLVFAAIAGIPQDLSGDNFTAMLEHPDMQYTPILDEVTNGETVRLKPSCVSADGLQDADPARRIVEVARGLVEGNEVGEAGVTVQSICAESFAPALDAVLEIVGNKLNVCLPRELNPNAAGFVTCDIIETLPEGESCDTGRGREFVDTALGRERCRIQQLQVPGDRATAEGLSCSGGECGWYYDTVSPAVDACPDARKQTLSFSEGAEPIPGSTFRLECLQPVQNTSAGENVEDVGGACTSGAICRAEDAGCARNLICDPQLLVWRQPCNNDSDCSFGAICDTAGETPVCVNPTCAQ